MTAHPDIYDVAIIGAGPAGLAAVEQITHAGASVIIIDEQPRIGGQIMRQPPKQFRVGGWLKGGLYKKLKALLERLENSSQVTWQMQTTVSGLNTISDEGTDRGFQLWILDANGLDSLRAKKVLIATGCYERPVVFPGATTPGVMGTGAIQTLLKSQQICVGENFVLAGAHPLQLVVAEQIIAAGGKVKAIAFSQSPVCLFSAWKQPSILLSHWRTFAVAALSIWRIKKAGVPILFSCAIKKVEGSEHVTSVTLQSVTPKGEIRKDKPERVLTADTLGLCYGFQVSSELARQIGAKAQWTDTHGGWTICHSDWMETNIGGLFVAGEITGMTGADAGHAEGFIAGTGIARSLELLSNATAQKRCVYSRKQLKKHNKFAQFLNQLSRLSVQLLFGMASDESLLCRCENVRYGTVKEALKTNPAVTKADGVKLLTRAGMGLCQGRLCYANSVALIQAHRNITVEEIGPFYAQWPAKPLAINTLIASKK